MSFSDILAIAVGQISHYFYEKNYDIMNYAMIMNDESCFMEKNYGMDSKTGFPLQIRISGFC